MKTLAFVAAMLLAGCASTFSSAPARNQDVVAQNQEVAQREKQCEEEATRQTNAEVARLATGADNLAELEIKNAIANGRKPVSACKAQAVRENDAIVRRQIAEYNLQAEEQRDRSALMATLTGTRIH